MSDKLHGDCPRCGANYHLYVFDGRFKRCYACGYDRWWERAVADVRHADKWGRTVSIRKRNKITEYLNNLKEL